MRVKDCTNSASTVWREGRKVKLRRYTIRREALSSNCTTDCVGCHLQIKEDRHRVPKENARIFNTHTEMWTIQPRISHRPTWSLRVHFSWALESRCGTRPASSSDEILAKQFPLRFSTAASTTYLVNRCNYRFRPVFKCLLLLPDRTH